MKYAIIVICLLLIGLVLTIFYFVFKEDSSKPKGLLWKSSFNFSNYIFSVKQLRILAIEWTP